jgi:hypothetical protein
MVPSLERIALAAFWPNEANEGKTNDSNGASNRGRLGA